MSQFRIEIVGVGKNGCDHWAAPGERLRSRCGRLNCVDCRILDLIQAMKSYGVVVGSATITHNFGGPSEVTDDVLKGVRLGEETAEQESANGSK